LSLDGAYSAPRHGLLALEVVASANIAGTSEAVTEDDESVRSRTGKRILLADHSRGVRSKAAELASKTGLAAELAQDIELAAFLHDAGKAHPAFKMWLYGGDELAALGPPLAKSGQRLLGDAARARARLPYGARHEAASVRIALAHPALERAHDRDLVLWLVGTHHGYGRPCFPPVSWPPPDDVFEVDLGDGSVSSVPGLSLENLSSGWVELFERLRARYGPWQLAYLEAVLRLADHRRSEEEQLHYE
jgi:CRISPR-associated endonuclease/helicase Cas3